jgi:glycosyltransferase involved in cell wall biosynthesis
MSGSGAPAEIPSAAPDARPLRVGYVLHRFPHLTETFIVREMHWLQRYGIELSIFSLMAPKSSVISPQAEALVPLAQYSRMFSFEVVRAQAHFLARRPLRYLRALGRLIWQTYREPRVMGLAVSLFPKSVLFARRVEQMGIEHLHANFVWLEGLAAGVARDLTGVSFTIQPHAFGLFSRNQRDVRRELENATRVVTISDYHRRYIAGLSPRISVEDIDVVHCGIEPDRISPAAARMRNVPPRIVSVGRAVEKKGHRYLIDACAELARRGVDFRCDLIVGRGGLRDELAEQVTRLELGEVVRLLDSRDEDGVFEILGGADIFALGCVVADSGDRDGIPVSLMEAMASGIPVVSTPVTGVPELIEDGRSGLLVQQRDSEALADAIARLLDDEGLATRLAAAGRRKIVDDFLVSDSAAKMAAIFRAISEGTNDAVS